MTEPQRPFHLVIVGGGPRCLFCLESLLRELDPQRCAGLRITIFEPEATLGAGPIYDPAQPPFLRMNLAANAIDVWSTEDDNRRTDERPFREWYGRRTGAEVAEDAYVPRNIVGRYLEDCFDQVVDRLRLFVSIDVISQRVHAVEAVGEAWKVHADSRSVLADHLLLTVGHGGWRPAAIDSPELCAADVNCVFPVEQLTGPEAIGPGSTVAIRGFALTCIDAILSLTEGRGGRFRESEGNLHYERNGLEPERILPFSRTGRPMLVKPSTRSLGSAGECEPIWTRGRERIRSIDTDDSRPVVDRIVRTLQESAADVLSGTGNLTRCDQVEDWLERWTTEEPSFADTIATIRTSYRIAIGDEPIDIGWALGESWRKLYPSIVDHVSHRRLPEDEWPAFTRIAVEMERIAFGPPIESVGRLLCLIDAGLVDLSMHRVEPTIGDDHRMRMREGDRAVEIDHLIQSIIPSPFDLPDSGPLASLLDSGEIRRLHGSLGIEVDEAGHAIASTGVANRTLSVLGRATEGAILGNDTLGRGLHDHPHRWAKSVTRQIIDAHSSSAVVH